MNKNAQIKLSREEKVDEILASDKAKTNKITKLADLGLTRTEVLKLDFVDPTLVYEYVQVYVSKIV